MKLLMLLPLLIFACITTQLKTCTTGHGSVPQKNVVEPEAISPLNSFFLFK